MKNATSYLFTLAMTLMWACVSEPVEEPEKIAGEVNIKTSGPIILSDKGERAVVEFSATLNWTATSSESWLIIDPADGKAGNNITVGVNAAENTAFEPRSATITFKSGEDTKTIDVSQKQKGALIVTETSVQVGAEGGAVSITAQANSIVTASIDQAAASWITDITPKGLVDYAFQFEIAANTETTSRSGKIVFSNEAGSKTVTVEQEGAELALVEAELGRATSCSLSFTWTEGVSAEDDIAKPWTIALYKDASCTDLLVSHNIPAGSSCWSDKQPRFVFGGLEAGTDYWFKAIDTTEGDIKKSNAIKASTLPFTRIDASTVSNAKEGDYILAEDFSEVHYGPDEFDGAAGFMPSPHTLSPITGENPDGTFEKYSSTSTRLWGNNFEITEGTRLSHGWGFYGNSAVYSRVGYFRCATTSKNARTHIVTPKLAGIPDGFKATIEVTVTDRMYESNGDVGVFVASGLTMNSTTDRSSAYFGKYTGGGALDKGHALGIGTGSWQTKSVIIEGVTNQDQLLIGSYENINVSDKSKNRHNFAEITVKIVEINSQSRTTKVSIIGDSISTFKNYCDETKGGAYYPKSDCDVASVSDTWWHKLIYNKMSTGTFEKNISAGNTTIVQNSTGDSGAYWYGWDFGTRLQQKGIGNPDVVLIFGGTNDYGHTLYNSTTEELIAGVEMGAESFPSSAQSALDDLLADADAATTVEEADALDGSTFCGAYIRLIKMVQTRHPDAKIVCVIGDYLYKGMGEAILKFVPHFGEDKVRAVDILGKYGFHANSAIPKYNYAHPTAAGMSVIANEVYNTVGDWIDVQE